MSSGAALLALAALFWPAALRRMFVYADLGAFFIPVRLYLTEQLARGVVPLWMPELFCGFYAHGEGHIGIFHPLRWLIYRLLPFPEAFNLECLLSYPLALCGMALFLRRLALPGSAALFGGASFAFSAYLTLRLTHLGALEVVAHLGWLLFAIDVLVRESGRTRWRAWVGLAVLTGSQLLIGYPIAIAYCWMIAVPYLLYAAASRRELAPLAAAASAIGVGIALGGIQLLPTWDHFTDSQRAVLSFESASQFSLHPLNLLTAVAPWLFRNRIYQDGPYDPIERVMYFGPVVPIAAVWVGLRWRNLGSLRPLVAGLAALSALALVLALGAHTPLYRYFVALPLVGSLRAPARYSLAIYFTGAVFAAIALWDLSRGDASRDMRRKVPWIWIVPAASCAVAGIALALHPGPVISPNYNVAPILQLGSPLWIAIGPLGFLAAAALFTAAVFDRHLALYALIALALADGVGYAATQWWVDPPRTLAEFRATTSRSVADPPHRVATPTPWRAYVGVDGRGHWWASTPMIMQGAQLVSGYAGLLPAKQLDYSKPASLRVASASVSMSINDRRIERLSGALPRARLVSRAIPSSQPALDIEAIDVESTALVEEPLDLAVGPPGAAAIQEDRPGGIRIAVDAPTRQLLVLSESYHAGWQADVDGAEAHVLRVNGDFMGVVVQPGAHVVSLSFAPRSFALGCWTSLAGLAIVLVVGLVGLARPA